MLSTKKYCFFFCWFLLMQWIKKKHTPWNPHVLVHISFFFALLISIWFFFLLIFLDSKLFDYFLFCVGFLCCFVCLKPNAIILCHKKNNEIGPFTYYFFVFVDGISMSVCLMWSHLNESNLGTSIIHTKTIHDTYKVQ